MHSRTPALVGTLALTLLSACASNANRPAPAALTSYQVDLPAVRHPDGATPEWWYRSGAARAAAHGAMAGKAKNVILFLGDGMSLPTVAAARILDGQRKGGSGEENLLSWEHFPATALSKTYNTDAQVPDSAGTMTAITTGVKSHMGAIGVSAGRTDDCSDSLGKHALTWLELADSAGLATGVVSTARLTHATPASTFAHVPNRGWENDAALPAAATAAGCKDIAQQLLASTRFGQGPRVVLGGGRKQFITVNQADPQLADKQGLRRDGRDLVAEWRHANPGGVYVTTRAELAAAKDAPSLFGLFNYDHMQYEHDRLASGEIEPSLAEMTRAAIANLSRESEGFVLMVEGARIDHASHEGNAYRALTEAIAMSEAVQAAVDATSAEDTLILVTADHAHTLNMVGYPSRGNPILGKVKGQDEFDGSAVGLAQDLNGLPYTTLQYANGPGNTGATDKQAAGPKRYPHLPRSGQPAIGRPDLTHVDTAHPDYMQEALVPMRNETHGGDDVGIWASGPGSHAVRGTVEQNVIYHFIVQATPKLRERLCAAKTCNADGVPVQLPKITDFEKR